MEGTWTGCVRRKHGLFISSGQHVFSEYLTARGAAHGGGKTTDWPVLEWPTVISPESPDLGSLHGPLRGQRSEMLCV